MKLRDVLLLVPEADPVTVYYDKRLYRFFMDETYKAIPDEVIDMLDYEVSLISGNGLTAEDTLTIVVEGELYEKKV